MRTIINFFLAAILLLSSQYLYAQKVVEKNLKYSSQKVSFDLKFADNISIKGWDKDYVSFKATATINNGKQNDAFKVSFNESANIIKVSAGLDQEELKKGKSEDCPDKSGSSYVENGQVTCTDINFEIYVPKNAAFNINTINGNIEIKGVNGSTEVKTISGFIDLTWPENQNADLSMKSITGELYTNLNFEVLNKQKNPPAIGYDVKGKINNGGPLIALETISSNIYLRKQE